MTTTRRSARRPRAPLWTLRQTSFPSYVAAISVLVSVGAATSAPSADDDARAARELIETAISRYEASATYSMEFDQETYWALADSTQTTSGVLVVRNPSSISVRYADGGRIVVNAGSLRVYVPQTNQFFSGPVDSSDIVVDPPRLLRQYVPDSRTPLDERPDGTAVVVLRHRHSGQEPRHLTVDIDRRNGLVTAISARTGNGDRTTYRVLDTRFGEGLPPDEFTLICPAGAELIEGGIAE